MQPGDTTGDTKLSTVLVASLGLHNLEPGRPKRVIKQPASSRIDYGNFVNLPAAYFGEEVPQIHGFFSAANS
jgi:hypothetical protein